MANIDYTNFEYYKLSDVNHDGVQYPGAVVQKNGAVYADQIIWGKVTIDGNEKDKATTEDVLTALESAGSIDPQELWGEFDPGTKLTYHKKVTLENGSEVNVYGESSDKYRLTRPEENDLIDNEEEEEDEEDTPDPSVSPTPDPSVSPTSITTTSAPTLRPGEGIGVAGAIKYDDVYNPLNKKTGTDYYELSDPYTYFMLYTDNDDVRESITVNIGNLQFI